MLNSYQLAIVLQGTGYFLSIMVLGFAYGHDRAVRDLVKRDPDYDPKRAAWLQTEIYASAKAKARQYFPLYWYWGNYRTALFFGLIALLTEITGEVGFCSAAEPASALIAVTYALLFYQSKRPKWNQP